MQRLSGFLMAEVVALGAGTHGFAKNDLTAAKQNGATSVV